ncbi:transketolase [Blastopirellula marina]|uniref:Transketolase n=1 Tax=Blastopirellula marina TaxID=124 RepID=A0A2S8FI31_9BACT|nr:transketolase [Blastopirellula marina]PQO31740.1 transketolase [Blastopirellula marina]PTL43047.1 transketolase [Blastopirellula marina]
METQQKATLQQLAANIRRWILNCTNRAGSGHPTSSLSAVELMVALFFDGHFRYDLDEPRYVNNDRLIFSKGHASPLFYALWCAADAIDEDDLMTYRRFDSVLEGHPTSRFRYTEAATGSLGQGLSIGVGMAMNAKYVDELPYRTYVLLGDSEMAEGSQWEAMEIACQYRLNNLVGVLDVNRLGQRGPTMQGHNLSVYQKRVEAFGWNTIVVPEGHNLCEISAAYEQAKACEDRPTMLIAHTLKGKGVSFLEDQEGWHGKALDDEQLQRALNELEEAPDDLRGALAKPQKVSFPVLSRSQPEEMNYPMGEKEATRTAYGNAITRLGDKYANMVVLDGEVSNSTRAEYFQEQFPERYFEMYIAEQNMVGAALGMALRGKTPFVSTFAAFFSRAFDQIRMCPYSGANIKFVGSHAGTEIGQDGPSQMGLEDIAMFRAVFGSIVLYPSDAVSTEKCVEQMANCSGIAYLRTTRGKLPILYDKDERFPIGGSKVLRQSGEDQVTLVAAGATLHEALAAAEQLEVSGISARVIDLYSVKPLDVETLRTAARETPLLITIEDHFAAGGIGEAVCSVLSEMPIRIHSLCVDVRPRSGTTEQLFEQQGISASKIMEAVKASVTLATHTEK